jgi:hypothetical protein
MREWLTIDVVLTALLVTSTICFALLALWAATSRRHWFVRVAAVLASLLPLLLIPAYELFVAFAIQCTIVACGAHASRWQERRRLQTNGEVSDGSKTQATAVHFSLSTMLLTMLLIAVAIPIAIKLPPLNFAAWGSIAADGVVCGVATLIAAWMCVSNHKWFAWPAGLIATLIAGLLLSYTDWLVFSIVRGGGWPPIPLPPLVAGLAYQRPIVFAWSWSLPMMVLGACALLLMWPKTPTSKPCKNQVRSGNRFEQLGRRCATASLVMLLAAFPLFIFWKLLHPSHVPPGLLPQPNGYDDIVAAGSVVRNNSPILDTQLEPTSTAQLASEVAKFSNVFAQIRLGLSRQFQTPVWPTDSRTPLLMTTLMDVTSLRSAARALMREAELAQQQGRFADATSISIENMRLGQAVTRGGVLNTYFIGLALEGIGRETLYPAIVHLDASTCKHLNIALQQLERDREPIDDVLHRDRIYDENAYGWFGHLFVLLHDFNGDYGNNHRSEATSQLPRVQAIDRLLMTELALRAYKLEHNALPE